MSKSAFIIGGCGFLGRHLTEDLHSRGYSVTIFDIHQTYTDERFNFITGDIADQQLLADSMRGHDVVFHVASPPYHLNDKELFYKVNVVGAAHVVAACEQAGIRKLVLTSSCSVVYGGKDLRNADETTPVPDFFLDYYTETKMLQEKANSDTLFTVAIRPHGIFGPFDYTVSEILLKAKQGKMKYIIGDGSNLVDFTYVRNVTHGHILAAEKLGENSVVNGQVFNITNDEPVQFWVFIGILLQKAGYETPSIHLPYSLILGIAYLMHFLYALLHAFMKQPFLTPFKVSLAGTHHYYNCDKAKNLLGYKPVVSLSDGIDKTMTWVSTEKSQLLPGNE